MLQYHVPSCFVRIFLFLQNLSCRILGMANMPRTKSHHNKKNSNSNNNEDNIKIVKVIQLETFKFRKH